jgi:ABC-type uncharacterized transport system ATPase subunit
MSSQRTPAVRLDGITKRFGDVVANDEVDFTLENGSIHALVGENGAGKSTLMSVLYGLYDPDAGTVAVDGQPRAFDSPRDAIDAGVGMIHQHFQLVDTMTVVQNVVLGHEPTEGGLVDTSSARSNIEDICSTYGFEVDEYLDTTIEELGVGIQQRVEIVKSLYRGGRCTDSRRADRRPHPTGGREPVRRDGRTRRRGSLAGIHHPQTGRGDGRRRRYHRPS